MALTAADALDAATAAVDDYCPGSPPAIRTAAIGRLANWIQRYPSDGVSNLTHSDQTVSWQPSALASGIMLSGASGLLAPFRRPRGRVIEAAP